MPLVSRLSDLISGVFQSLTAFRLIYSLLLLMVLFVVGRHLVSIWDRGKLSLSDFSYFVDGKSNSDRATQLREETVQEYGLILGLLKSFSCHGTYQASKSSGTNNEDQQPESRVVQDQECERLTKLVTQKADTLSQIDITIQGITIKNALAVIGNLIAPSGVEIGVKIFESDGQRRTFISVSGTKAALEQQSLSRELPKVSASSPRRRTSKTPFGSPVF